MENNSQTPEPTAVYNDMQTIKRRFFAMRNGIIADVLRRGGSPFRIIFGLNLPQIVEIAAETEPSADLACRLWANTTTRESMLAAPMIFPREDFDLAMARRWCAGIPTPEVADVLCHRLLRHRPFAAGLADELLAPDNTDISRYTGLRLYFNIVSTHTARALEAARTEATRHCPLTERMAAMLIEEAEFILEGEN